MTSATLSDEKLYQLALESTVTWNARLMTERKLRQPYLDNTTGLAQGNCNLWMSGHERRPGQRVGQLYSYPAKRWRKKKREVMPEGQVVGQSDAEIADAMIAEGNPEMLAEKNLDAVVTIKPLSDPITKEKWFTGYEDFDELGDFEDDDPYEDDSDYEEGLSRKKGKKKAAAQGGVSERKSKRVRNEEAEKPHVCDLCSARYKTRPGLQYHYTHYHGAELEDSGAADVMGPQEIPVPAVEASTSAKSRNKVPNDYCDFCLGDADMNKKTKLPEEMVSCADCGRSGHPTCLQFTANMKISVRKYPWQCIECKSCGLCGTSENDDQLLFCDDCDRGYHMYCLTPPLSSPPEGNWSCHLCIREFHGGVKPSWMA